MTERNNETLVNIEKSNPNDVMDNEAAVAVHLVHSMLEDVYGCVVQKHKYKDVHLVFEGLMCGKDIPSVFSSKCSHATHFQAN